MSNEVPFVGRTSEGTVIVVLSTKLTMEPFPLSNNEERLKSFHYCCQGPCDMSLLLWRTDEVDESGWVNLNGWILEG